MFSGFESQWRNLILDGKFGAQNKNAVLNRDIREFIWATGGALIWFGCAGF